MSQGAVAWAMCGRQRTITLHPTHRPFLHPSAHASRAFTPEGLEPGASCSGVRYMTAALGDHRRPGPGLGLGQ